MERIHIVYCTSNSVIVNNKWSVSLHYIKILHIYYEEYIPLLPSLTTIWTIAPSIQFRKKLNSFYQVEICFDIKSRARNKLCAVQKSLKPSIFFQLCHIVAKVHQSYFRDRSRRDYDSRFQAIMSLDFRLWLSKTF